MKIYPNNDKILFAATMMCVNRVGNKSYSWLRKKHSLYMKKRVGELNHQHGTCWISNPNTHENRKIKKNDPLPTGYYYGRNNTFKICDLCNKSFIKSLRNTNKFCSKLCLKEFRIKISEEEAKSMLFDYESGMDMKDILNKYNRKCEQNITTFLRKRFPNRQVFLPKERSKMRVV